MKRLLLFSIALFAIWSRLFAYDFSAVAPSGQTLCYRISYDSTVYVTYERYDYNVLSPSYTNLTGSLIIPSTVTYNGATYSVTGIDGDAFKGCTGLMDVTIPNSVTEICNAFEGCTGLSEPIYNEHIFAYFPCGYADSYAVPNGITTIAAGAFRNCANLQSLIVPITVNKILGAHNGHPISPFQGCTGLTSVYYTGSISDWCQINFYSNLGGICNPLYYAHNLYINNTLVTGLVIPDDVSQINSGAFAGATCLTSLSLGNSVTKIGDYAFYGCTGLVGELIIPESVTQIGEGSFYNCTGLTSVRLQSPIDFWRYAFIDCSGLNSVYFNGTVADWCQQMYFRSGDANPLYYAHNLYVNNTLVTNLTIPTNVTKINQFAFCGATCLTSVDMPSSVDSIELGAFAGCTGLLSVTISPSASSIGEQAFSGCIGLTSITIPPSILSIGEFAFSGCIGLATVNFNATNCTDIGGNIYRTAFYGCTNIETLNIGNNVTNIPSTAFYGCSSLTTPNTYW